MRALHPLWRVRNDDAKNDLLALGNVAAPAAACRVRLVPEELAVARRRFRILVDRQQNGLDVMIAPPFMHPDPPDLCQRLDERRMLGRVAEVFPHVRPRRLQKVILAAIA